jgi:hypothetical protein
MTRADDDACSSAFSSSGSNRTYSSLAISYPSYRLLAQDDPMDGTLEAHLDPGAASRVEQMERDALGARGGKKLDGNDGEAEGDVEVLQRARHGLG